MEKKAFTEALKKAKIPVLVLDQKWHRLFAIKGKPDRVKELEEQLSDILARQGKMTQELKDLKRLKSNLMKNIVDNMDAIDTPSEDAKSKKMEEDRQIGRAHV